jgi:hypothetical protein
MTDSYQLTIPKDHLLSILQDPEMGRRSASPASRSPTDPRSGEVTLLYSADTPGRPFLIVVPTAEQREILARIGTFGGDLAPITQWIRVVTADWARRLISGIIEPRMNELIPAWVGAIIGEILAHQESDLSSISMNWVHASATFAVARSHILWNDIRSADRVVGDVEKARSLLRSDQIQHTDGLQKICGYLADLEEPPMRQISHAPEDELIRKAMKEIRSTGTITQETIELLAGEVRDLKDLAMLDAISPEDRVRLFDRLAGVLRESSGRTESIGSNLLQFSMGYIVGRIGAGEANLELIRDLRGSYPSMMVWAAALPALFRPFPWGHAFDGFGRLVLKELISPLHPEDMPNADVSLDELSATMNPKVGYKRLPFRTAQRNFALIELIPGVCSAVSLSGVTRSGRTPSDPEGSPRQASLHLPKPVETRSGTDFHSFLIELKGLVERHLAQPSSDSYERSRSQPDRSQTRRGSAKRSN